MSTKENRQVTSMLPFHQVVKSEFAEVNNLIINRLNSEVQLIENIGQYIIDGGGKRLRPLLVLLSANSFGYKGTEHIALAAIIEFIHTATLLHDDVVDTSELRRGQATANTKYGNAPSVLVGDFLYSRAFQMLVAIGHIGIMKIIATSTNIISEGEVQQLINARNSNINETEYKQVIFKKTAVLFDAASEIGALIAQSTSKQQAALSSYGRHVGMAFQLMDDALDYDGDIKVLGKNIGDDLTEGKTTLPLIYAMKNGTKQQSLLIQEAIKNANFDKLDAICDILKTTGALNYTKSSAHTHALKATQSLESLPDTKEKRAMIEIAKFSVERNY
jgi:octaprenyl-diphosphate synthase